MLETFNLCYEGYQKEFETYLQSYLKDLKTKPSVLGESMRYSLQSGGKRIRPVLALACADILGLEKQEILPFALALEMIHTYSLIHDDLPAMDNDDFRRGQPTNHKKFGEANAILAGDGLLNEAYSICFYESKKGEKYLLASAFLNECAGIYGMIAGQSADLYFSEPNRQITEEELLYIYAHKTGKLLLAPIMLASILKDNKNYLEFERFGKLLGLLFQMTDDILDEIGTFEDLGKSVRKDASKNKLTCVKLYGLDGAKLRADICARNCHAILESIDGDTTFLHGLIDYILSRKK